MFITLEGMEGSGKTTQLEQLANFLREQGRPTVETREPGGTAIGRQVRDVLHDLANTALAAQAEILLYAADRAQHVSEVIRPALARRDVVLCDRYADSTLAYQGYGRGLDLEELRWIIRFATGGLVPDLTFYLEVDIEVGLQRRAEGSLEMNRMDRQTTDFYRRVQAGYRTLIEAEPDRWVVINADRPAAVIQADLRRVIAARLQIGAPGG